LLFFSLALLIALQNDLQITDIARDVLKGLFAADYQSEIESLHKQPMGKNTTTV
jgi:hypothetical protein